VEAPSAGRRAGRLHLALLGRSPRFGGFEGGAVLIQRPGSESGTLPHQSSPCAPGWTLGQPLTWPGPWPAGFGLPGGLGAGTPGPGCPARPGPRSAASRSGLSTNIDSESGPGSHCWRGRKQPRLAPRSGRRTSRHRRRPAKAARLDRGSPSRNRDHQPHGADPAPRSFRSLDASTQAFKGAAADRPAPAHPPVQPPPRRITPTTNQQLQPHPLDRQARRSVPPGKAPLRSAAVRSALRRLVP